MVHSPMANEESLISFSFTQVTFGHRDARAIEKHKDNLIVRLDIALEFGVLCDRPMTN